MSRRAPKGVVWAMFVCAGALLGGSGCSTVKVVGAKCHGPSFKIKETVTIKKDKHIIVWASDAKNLQIEWKASNPFPYPVRCDGDKFCAVLAPSSNTGTYQYTVKGECPTGPALKDPQVEIVDAY